MCKSVINVCEKAILLTWHHIEPSSGPASKRDVPSEAPRRGSEGVEGRPGAVTPLEAPLSMYGCVFTVKNVFARQQKAVFGGYPCEVVSPTRRS